MRLCLHSISTQRDPGEVTTLSGSTHAYSTRTRVMIEAEVFGDPVELTRLATEGRHEILQLSFPASDEKPKAAPVQATESPPTYDSPASATW